jgi:hypothetical protein
MRFSPALGNVQLAYVALQAKVKYRHARCLCHLIRLVGTCAAMFSVQFAART